MKHNHGVQQIRAIFPKEVSREEGEATAALLQELTNKAVLPKLLQRWASNNKRWYAFRNKAAALRAITGNHAASTTS